MQTIPHTIFALSVLFAGLTATVASAQPITVRGIDWMMSPAERLATLETLGLRCRQVVGWGAFIPFPRTETNPTYSDSESGVSCIDADDPDATFGRLNSYFAEWERICGLPMDGVPGNPTCIGYNQFSDLRKYAEKVWISNENDRITFRCGYVGTCTYDVPTIIRALRKDVLDREFKLPSADAWMTCADGPAGDSLCIHRNRDIFLLREPYGSDMKF